MKKLLAILVSLFLLIGLLSCSNDNNNPQDKPDNPDPVVDPDPKPSEKKEVYITYYDGEDIIQMENYVDEIKLYNYSYEGFVFKGWYLDSECTIPFDITKSDEYFKKDSMNLYAKMEKIMEDFNIRTALINNKTVINPVFSWNNNNNSSYQIKLLKGDEILKELQTDKTYYQVDERLEVNTDYKFVVKDLTSNIEKTFEFTTMDSYDDSIKTITLSDLYCDNMVIQRDTENILRGIGPIKQHIAVKIGDDEFFGLSGDGGEFEIKIPARSASFVPANITITNNIGVSKEIKNVLFGDVYLFAGQSNMQWPTQNSDYKKSDIDNFSNLSVRFFCQDVTTSTTMLEHVKNGRWFVPNNSNVAQFSAIATMAGSLLGSELQNTTPIGIVTAYQGDTNIANWMSPEFYNGTCATKHLHYNAMVYPLHDAKLSGVVWYQGCNNSAAGIEYKDLLLKFFANYRSLFNNQDLPFYVIGLACYDGDNGNNFDFSYVRESQAKACTEDSHAYFISTCDNGDPTYIHPSTKRYICERISKSICSTIYHKNYYAEGPSYKSHTVSGNKVYVELNNAEGLKSVGKITGFYIAGSDGKYHEAIAIVEEGRIIASSEQVANPVYIKYGFGKSPFVNIFNKDDFAITPFRTDEYNTNIDLFDYDVTDNYTFHPDGSKMEVSKENGALRIKKTKDGKTYGSVKLDKWGAIAYNPEGFRFSFVGTGSGAFITFRAVEGDSYEIWGYKVLDDVEGIKTIEVSTSDFTVVYNKQNNIFDTQKISYVEIMIESSDEVTIDLLEARFIKLERSAPRGFYIMNSIYEHDNKLQFSISDSLFANGYNVKITDENNNDIYTYGNVDFTNFSVDLSLFTKGKPYYINAYAVNELGTTPANNNNFLFYLQETGRKVICNFDFASQTDLDSYIETSMSVHAGLTCELIDKKVKITSAGKGWQQFIFKLNPGDGDGMTKLEFYADFSNYKGEIIMQLADTSYNTYNYTINLNEQKEGNYIINFNEFKKGSTPFTNQTLMWVMFNFNDSVGDGYIILDDVSLSK